MVKHSETRNILSMAIAVGLLVSGLLRPLWFQGPAIDLLLIVPLGSLLVALAERSSIPDPAARGLRRLTPAADLAVLLLAGPGPALAAAVTGRLLMSLRRGRPVARILSGVSAALITIGVAGLAGTFALRAGWMPVFAAAPVGLLARLLPAPGEGDDAGRFGARRWLVDLSAVAVSLLLAAIPGMPVAARLSLCFFVLLPFHGWERARRRMLADHMRSVRTLMSLVDSGNVFTRGLSYRVSRLALALGRRLGLDGEEIGELEYAALMHDVGRLAIQRDVLQKSGRLNDDEIAVMQTHPRIGHDIVKELGFFPGAAGIVLSHHERMDGSGYPGGLAAEAIPLAARIIMVAAAFDALTMDRPYRRGLHPAEAMAEIRRHSGSQFDPAIVRALNDLHESGHLYDSFSLRDLTLYTSQWSGSRAVDDMVDNLVVGSAESGAGGPADARGRSGQAPDGQDSRDLRRGAPGARFRRHA